MRLSSTVILADGTSATVTELTVADVRRLLAAGGELVPESILALCPDAIRVERGVMLDDASAITVWEEFVRLNRAVFDGPKRRSMVGPRAVAKSTVSLDESCLLLVEQGHAHIWDYPYRLYRQAVEMKRGGK